MAVPSITVTWNEIFSRMRNLLTEAQASTSFGDDELGDWFYDGLLLAIYDAPIEVFHNYSLMASMTIDFTNGTDSYSLPSMTSAVQPRYIRQKTLLFKQSSTGSYKYATYYDWDEYNAKKTRFPDDKSLNYYSIWEKKIYVFPKPTETFLNAGLFYYIGAPHEFVAGGGATTLEIPRALLSPSLYYGCGLAKIKDYEPNSVNNFFTLYDRAMNRLNEKFAITPPEAGLTPEKKEEITRR